jgi:hypothetical protein
MIATGRPKWLLRDQMQDSASLSIVWRECSATTVTERALWFTLYCFCSVLFSVQIS